MQRLASEGLALYSQWQAERNVFFNSTFIAHPDGNIVVDPLPLSSEDAREIGERGGLRYVVITNTDHARASLEVARAFNAHIVAREPDASALPFPVDRVIVQAEALAEGIIALGFEGLKTAGEFALHLPARRAAILGDALWGEPAGALRMLPDEKLGDPVKAVRALQRLWALRLDMLIVGDGTAILHDADRVLGEFLQSRSDVFVNRINLDELAMEPFDDLAGRYAGSVAEIGLRIGARHLGYRLVILPPGKRFSPLHSHEAEEELFLVLDGNPTVRTPRGSIECRKGDVIAFPAGDAGAHQLLNTSAAPCTVFMLGEDDVNEVAYYPDSNKLWVRSRQLLLRADPQLDYYEGE